MAFDDAFLRIPISGLTIGGNSYVFVVRECSVVRNVFEHDSVTMSATLAGTLRFDNKLIVPINEAGGTRDVTIEQFVDQPMSFVMGVPPNSELFTGYVSSVNPTQRFKQGIDFEIEISGASIALQQANRYFDTDKSIYDLIRLRTSSAGLTLFCDNYLTGSNGPYLFPSMGQTEESDWEFIVSLAQLVGYAVFTWGPVIRICDPVRLLSGAPRKRLVTGDNVLDSEKQLMDFYGTENSDALWQYQGIKVFQFDNLGQVVSIAQNSPNIKKYQYTNTIFPNEDSARLAVDAAARQIDRWRYSATARIKGDASIYPGMLVQIDTGQNSIAGPYNGNWLVLGVEHSMNRTAFDTKLTLARPANMPNQSAQNFRPFWAEFNSPQPNIVLRNNSIYGKSWGTQFDSLQRGGL